MSSHFHPHFRRLQSSTPWTSPETMVEGLQAFRARHTCSACHFARSSWQNEMRSMYAGLEKVAEPHQDICNFGPPLFVGRTLFGVLSVFYLGCEKGHHFQTARQSCVQPSSRPQTGCPTRFCRCDFQVLCSMRPVVISKSPAPSAKWLQVHPCGRQSPPSGSSGNGGGILHIPHITWQ